MPGKHVRFTDQDIIYSPAPSTPSPTFSESSLPSTTGPITPPQNAYVPLPSGPVYIHPALAFNNQRPPLNYDASAFPTTASLNSHSSPSALPAHVLAEPATNPPMTALTLKCEMLPWQLTIWPSGVVTPFVTVQDVLEQLYRFLRLGATADEYKALPSQAHRDRVAEAYRTRCMRAGATSGDAFEIERRKGLKRVDFLVGRTKFLGLISTKLGPNVWALHFDRSFS